VRTWTEGGEVLVEVRDTGCGIPPENLARIFDPFFTTKPPGFGSGLGLPICYSTVKSYGGRIDVKSEVGKGSSFVVRLTLPTGAELEPMPGKTAAEKGRDARPAARGRVLVVDDEPLIGAALRRMLDEEHDVVVAGSGAEGKEILERDPAFDIILCDLMMPDVSGMDFYAWIAETRPELARRMVFITGGAFTPRAADFLKTVPNVHMAKPFEQEDILALIRNLLGPPGGRDEGGR
jgi:CheY-like chemotaxis protein